MLKSLEIILENELLDFWLIFKMYRFAYHPNRAVFSGHWLFAKLTKSRWTRVEFAYHPDIPVFSGSWLFSTFEEWPEDRLDLPLNNSRYLGVWASTESEDLAS